MAKTNRAATVPGDVMEFLEIGKRMQRVDPERFRRLVAAMHEAVRAAEERDRAFARVEMLHRKATH